MDVQLKLSKASPPHIHIPEEIIEEIISRLPVETVLRCRCLSKPWRSLIGTKRFIAEHLRNSPPAFRFILKCGFGSGYSRLQSPFFKQFIGSLSSNRFADCVSAHTRVVGCVNGLVCFYDAILDVFSFWNPSTRVTTALPKVKCPSSFRTLGFGFDESAGEFKVLFVYQDIPRLRFYIKIYRSRSNSWRYRIASPARAAQALDNGVFVRGKLHWAKNLSKQYVTSFDVKTEAFGELELPPFALLDPRLIHSNFIQTNHTPKVILGVLGGRLSSLLGYNKYFEFEVEVWVMEEYGVKESWTKVVNLRPPYSLATPFCTGSNGEILFVYGSYFLAYYPNDNVFRCFGHSALYGGVYHCIQSLVTPDYAAQ